MGELSVFRSLSSCRSRCSVVCYPGDCWEIWTYQKTTAILPQYYRNATARQPEPNKSSQSLADRIVTFLRGNRSASRREIAEALDGATEGSVRYQLDKLKTLRRLRRIGPDTGGHWMVIDRFDAADNKIEACAGDEAEGALPENSQVTSEKAPENSQSAVTTARKQPEPPPIPDRIVAVLRQKPTVGRRAIAAMLDTTESTVPYHLDKLRTAGNIERVGPDKGGYWKVLAGSVNGPTTHGESRRVPGQSPLGGVTLDSRPRTQRRRS